MHIALGGTGGSHSGFLLSRSEGHHHNNKGHLCGATQTGIFGGDLHW